MVVHLLKKDSWVLTACGIDTEFLSEDILAVQKKQVNEVTCKRCISTLRKELQKEVTSENRKSYRNQQ